MILHVYTLGTFRFDGVGGDAVCDLIVDEDIRGGAEDSQDQRGFCAAQWPSERYEMPPHILLRR
jgi:hypothetical protein